MRIILPMPDRTLFPSRLASWLLVGLGAVGLLTFAATVAAQGAEVTCQDGPCPATTTTLQPKTSSTVRRTTTTRPRPTTTTTTEAPTTTTQVEPPPTTAPPPDPGGPAAEQPPAPFHAAAQPRTTTTSAPPPTELAAPPVDVPAPPESTSTTAAADNDPGKNLALADISGSHPGHGGGSGIWIAAVLLGAAVALGLLGLDRRMSRR
jgi:hypothetical protein